MSKLYINAGQTKIYFSFVIMNYSEMLDEILTEFLFLCSQIPFPLHITHIYLLLLCSHIWLPLH